MPLALGANGERGLERQRLAGALAQQPRALALLDDHVHERLAVARRAHALAGGERPLAQRHQQARLGVDEFRRDRGELLRVAVLAAHLLLLALAQHLRARAHQLVGGVAVDALQAALVVDVGDDLLHPAPVVELAESFAEGIASLCSGGRGGVVARLVAQLVPALVAQRDAPGAAVAAEAVRVARVQRERGVRRGDLLALRPRRLRVGGDRFRGLGAVLQVAGVAAAALRLLADGSPLRLGLAEVAADAELAQVAVGHAVAQPVRVRQAAVGHRRFAEGFAVDRDDARHGGHDRAFDARHDRLRGSRPARRSFPHRRDCRARAPCRRARGPCHACPCRPRGTRRSRSSPARARLRGR